MAYRHRQTLEEEYPRTAREILHCSLEILVTTFPQGTIRHNPVHACAYSWPGAGSESGGSAEKLTTNTFVIIPKDADSSDVITVADHEPEWNNPIIFLHDDVTTIQGYSALIRTKIPKFLADTIESYAKNHLLGEEGSEKLWHVLHDILEPSVKHYKGVTLLAYDQPHDSSDARESAILRRTGTSASEAILLAEAFTKIDYELWNYLITGRKDQREAVAQFVADIVRGEGSEHELMNNQFYRTPQCYHVLEPRKVGQILKKLTS